MSALVPVRYTSFYTVSTGTGSVLGYSAPYCCFLPHAHYCREAMGWISPSYLTHPPSCDLSLSRPQNSLCPSLQP